MPTAVVVSVATEVVAMLSAAAGTFSIPTIEPVRSYADWELQLKDAGELHVDVVAVTTEQRTEQSTRGAIGFDVPVDICVRKRFEQASQDAATGRVELAEVDALMLLVEEIMSLFVAQRMTNFQSAAWEETKVQASPVRKHLHEWHQFTGIVRLTFKATKGL